METETVGTPVVTLGFTQEELDRMEEVAFPNSIEGWIHDLIGAALGLLPTGATGRDASKIQWNPPVILSDLSPDGEQAT